MMPDSDHARQNRIGIAWMVLGMSAFIANDAMIKAIGQRVPTAQMLVVRGVMAMTLIALVAYRMGVLHRFREIAKPWVVVRAGCEGVGTFFYLAALFHLPLANVTAINMSAPIFIAVMAAIFLRERVSAARWVAIVMGFVGVMLIVQPRPGDFNLAAWLSVLATLLYASRDLLTRKISPQTPSILITWMTAAVVWAMALAVLLFQGWAAMDWRDVGLLAIASVFLSTGYFALIASMRHGELSVVAPFRYVGLLWAILIGFVVWGDVPNLLATGGIVLLIAAGYYMILETRRRSISSSTSRSRSLPK